MKKILIVGAVHGTETIGPRVIAFLQAKYGDLPGVDYLIANPDALAAGKRCIEADLNRSCPGRPDGCKEERLAYELSKIIKMYDVVIDIHSTESGLRSAVIVTKMNCETLALASKTNAKYLLFMEVTEHNALISAAPIGIGFEYGSDKDPKVFADTVAGISLILRSLGHDVETNAVPTPRKICFRVSETIPKPRGFLAVKGVKNYQLVSKGQDYAWRPLSAETLKAEDDFYPILFGENKYKDIFGFKGYKLPDLE